MSMYRKRPDVVAAFPWWRNGDHPGDGKERDTDGVLREGKVVGFYAHPGGADDECVTCGRLLDEHGVLSYGQVVCPGDFIIGTPETGYTAMHPEAFAAAYAMDHDS